MPAGDNFFDDLVGGFYACKALAVGAMQTLAVAYGGASPVRSSRWEHSCTCTRKVLSSAGLCAMQVCSVIRWACTGLRCHLPHVCFHQLKVLACWRCDMSWASECTQAFAPICAATACAGGEAAAAGAAGGAVEAAGAGVAGCAGRSRQRLSLGVAAQRGPPGTGPVPLPTPPPCFSLQQVEGSEPGRLGSQRRSVCRQAWMGARHSACAHESHALSCQLRVLFPAGG